MQSRLIELLSQISIDEITVDLLRYNDEFNNSFKTYESYMQERERRVGSTQIPISNRTASPLKTSISNSQSPTKVNLSHGKLDSSLMFFCLGFLFTTSARQ